MVTTSPKPPGALKRIDLAMFEQDAARLIRAQGWRIAKGPYFNANLSRKGIYMWSIKTVLSASELKERGIKVTKSGKSAGGERKVRFIGEVVDGSLISVRHVSTSERKKIGSRIWRPGRKTRKRAAPKEQ